MYAVCKMRENKYQQEISCVIDEDTQQDLKNDSFGIRKTHSKKC